MSFLAPLYALGALAIAAPIVFHLIRRTTRGEVPFSSLLFLAPSPPKLTRRSRLDQWFLLLLRAAALALLAVAFGRPFLRSAANLNLAGAEHQRVLVLVDTSASMRRGDLWQQARAKATEVIETCRPDDQVAVFAFDAHARPVMTFSESAALAPAQRLSVAKQHVARLTPTWDATQLGQALIDAAGAIEDVGDTDKTPSKGARRIVLISDLQEGGRLETLGDFEWPSDVELDLKIVGTDHGNAGLEGLPATPSDATSAEAKDRIRVRVTNEPGAKRESFELAWAGSKVAPIPVYVPPGESRVVRVPRPAGDVAQHTLELRGDTQPFDNRLFVATRPRETVTVLFLGSDVADDPSGMLYYLSRALVDDPQRTVKVESQPFTKAFAVGPVRKIPLIVLATGTSAKNSAMLRAYMEAGGTLLDVVTSPEAGTTLAELAGVPAVEIQEGAVDGDLILGEIAFEHPLFAAFAGAQFHDFTKIHIWRYRQIRADQLGGAQVLAHLENGDAAVIEKPVGKGRLVVFSTSWAPRDSQLARSSKFVPLMSALLDGPGSPPNLAANGAVHEAVALPEGALAVKTPKGVDIALPPGTASFAQTDMPGVYSVATARGAQPFAVNLASSESRTAPLEPDDLERFGCRLTRSASQVAADRDWMRQMQNAELEGRQKLWRPLILATIAVLILETWLAGWLAQRARIAQAEASAT